MSKRGLFRRSTGFVAFAIVAVVVAWVVIRVVPVLALKDFSPNPVTPGKVNIIAVQRGSGYRIIVSNGIAHLVEVSDQDDESGFGAPDHTDGVDQQNARRLPIKEALASLQGDAVALGKLVMAIDNIKTDELSDETTVWKSEDVRKAIDGDVVLRAMLEKDLNTRLDGSPIDTISLNAIINGILVDSPVQVGWPGPDGTRAVVCRIQEPYKTLFAGSINKIIDSTFNISQERLAGSYRQEANKVLASGSKENVAKSLGSRIDPGALASKATGPERILSKMSVLINETHLTGASFVSYSGPSRSILCNIKLRLTEDGRKRLWKYSREHPRFQLILTVNGVAIAAPRINTELSENEVELTKVPSKELAEEAVQTITQSVQARN